MALLDDLWYPAPGLTWPSRLAGGCLRPLGGLWCLVATVRAEGYRRGWLRAERVGVPVLVVGNLTVGGTGKTPLVLWLVEHLRRRAGAAPAAPFGRAPGIVLRGYRAAGGRDARPRQVPADGDPAEFGDEPVLLARRAGCPVVIGRDRVAAARLLVAAGCDCVVADDGLQHLRLHRDLALVLIDGARGLGNGRCLPAGPLREPARRLHAADLVLVNGPTADPALAALPRMALVPGAAVHLHDPAHRRPLASFRGGPVTAVAGIGNPGRFFAMLAGLGLTLAPRPYPDHHAFTAADAAGWPPGPVLMTEKDAVKCQGLSPAGADHWWVPVSAEPDAAFVAALDARLAGVAR